MHRVLPGNVFRFIATDEHDRNNPRQAIDYLPESARYSDRVEEESSDVEAENGVRRTITAAPQRVGDVFSSRRDDADHETPHENAWSHS